MVLVVTPEIDFKKYSRIRHRWSSLVMKSLTIQVGYFSAFASCEMMMQIKVIDHISTWHSLL